MRQHLNDTNLNRYWISGKPEFKNIHGHVKIVFKLKRQYWAPGSEVQDDSLTVDYIDKFIDPNKNFLSDFAIKRFFEETLRKIMELEGIEVGWSDNSKYFDELSDNLTEWWKTKYKSNFKYYRDDVGHYVCVKQGFGNKESTGYYIQTLYFKCGHIEKDDTLDGYRIYSDDGTIIETKEDDEGNLLVCQQYGGKDIFMYGFDIEDNKSRYDDERVQKLTKISKDEFYRMLECVFNNK
jgi:hypothetical protein